MYLQVSLRELEKRAAKAYARGQKKIRARRTRLLQKQRARASRG